MAGGSGFGPWGSGPWGGGTDLLAVGDPNFDLFCFADVSMLQILLEPNVTVEGNGAQFIPNAINFSFEMASGGAFPTDDARLIVTNPVPQTFTVEWVVTFSKLPNDFTDLTNSHVYLCTTDAAGPLVGLFFSKVGVAYAGSVSFPGGDLSLDTTFTVIPGSPDFITEGEPYVIRVAADYVTRIVYLYITRLADLPISGQQLRAIISVIPYDAAANTPTDQALISIRGTLLYETHIELFSFCLSSSLQIANLAPVADAGLDQAVRSCSIIQLNGSKSFDPEGADLLYSWRLIEAPSGSDFLIEDGDGFTLPEVSPTGFTTKFYSEALGIIDALDALDVGAGGDVLIVRGVAYTIIGKGTDGDGFYVELADDLLADNLVNEMFKVLRQRGVSGPTTATPTFFPDKPGFYKFDLIVFDGSLFSTTSVTLINVLETPLPRGCTPDLSFIFTYLSDAWHLVEDRERLAVFWSALAQVAATELYSLWQIEYSKSLRDVQRYFVRRWLHYPLLLGEPLPELTKIRAIFGGITSSFIAVAGQGGINGTELVIQSSTLTTPVSLILVALNPVMAERLAADLKDQLQNKVDARFTTTVIENRTANTFAVRIDAPFPFTITSTTCPVFQASTATAPSGSGAGVGARIYKIDRSLIDLGLVEDDFIVLSGVAYRIARLLDDLTDDLPFQRVLLKENLPIVPSTTWAIHGWVSSELLNFYAGLVSKGDDVDLEISQPTTELATLATTNRIIATTVIGVSEALPSRLVVDLQDAGVFIVNEALVVYLARVLRRTYIPVDELVADVPTLQEFIQNEDDRTVLRRNVDFFIEKVRGQNAIRFVSGVNGGPSVWETSRPPFRLWAEYTYLDNGPTIEANFGIPVELTLEQLADLPNNVDYLSAVRGLWYAFTNGPTMRNLRVGTQILLGLPFAEEEGTILEIRTDFSPNFGRLLIRDTQSTQIVRSYRFPRSLSMEINPSTGARYKVGDVVGQFAPLIEGAEVIDYVSDPTWFEGLLNQGVFYEVEKFHKFLVRVNDAAFSLNTLLFVRNFILKIKPTYTFPMFVVQRRIGDTEVSTTDETEANATLLLFDSPCGGLLGTTYMFDEPRAAGGGVRNAFDADAVPLIPNGDPDPVFPTPDPENQILWGFDRDILCPSDAVTWVMCETFAPGDPIIFDSVFFFDTPLQHQLEYEQLSTPVIPAPPAQFTIPAVSATTAPSTGNITQLRFLTQGNPGASLTDYQVQVYIAGVAVHTQAFTAGINTEIIVSFALPVTLGQTVSVRVKAASGGVARNPAWSSLFAALTFSEASVWNFGDTLAGGAYCAEIPL